MSAPSELTDDIVALLKDHPSVSSLTLGLGVSLKPPGDLILADVAREGSNEVITALVELGVQKEGTLQLEPIQAWVSQKGFEAERAAPGTSADAVVWLDVIQRAYDDSELNWTFMTFMTLATFLAGIAIILDSQILTIGAMVLGPEFGCVAALGVALVQQRWALLGQSIRTLVLGFTVAMVLTTLLTLVGRWLGWVTYDDVVVKRYGTAFIYTPDKWSFIVAVIAAAAGVLSLTSARTGGLSGVFISVTTIPAAGNVAVAFAMGAWDEVWGSSAQLAINIVGMAVAGWLTLALQKAVWQRITVRSWRARGRLPKYPT